MNTMADTPEAVVQRQLDAYNARDLDAIMATFDEHVQVFDHPATLLAAGAAALRERRPTGVPNWPSTYSDRTCSP